MNLSIKLIALTLTTVVFYSCSRVEDESSNAIQPHQDNNKQLVVFDESGNNSVTLRLSSEDKTLIANHKAEDYKLVINPEVKKDRENTTKSAIEDTFEDFDNGIAPLITTIQMEVIKTNFSDKVSNYALISNSSFVNERMKDEESISKAGLCFWFPRDYQYYDVDAWGATSVRMEFNRTKKTCNNIKYYVCYYNTTTPYDYHHLKHPGDVATTNSAGTGITLLYKHYRNQTPTYTFYY